MSWKVVLWLNPNRKPGRCIFESPGPLALETPRAPLPSSPLTPASVGKQVDYALCYFTIGNDATRIFWISEKNHS